MKKRILKNSILIIVLVFCSNCAMFHKTYNSTVKRALGTENDELRYNYLQKTEHSVEEVRLGRGGSLYPGDTNTSNLFVDNKARYLNDTIKINIVETATAEGSANTGLEKKSELKASVPAFFGLENHAPTDWNLSNLAQSSMENSFAGKGEITRKGKVTATISARVIDIYPNGDLMVFGKQKIQINAEKQLISVKGIVRTSDIQPDNSIDSTQIANAEIEFTGRGVMNDKQRPGIVMRALDWLWPL